jgi:hypothetical protein
MRLINRRDDLRVAKIIACKPIQDHNKLFKHAVFKRIQKIATYLLEHCAYDTSTKDYLSELLREDKYDQAEDIVSLGKI